MSLDLTYNLSMCNNYLSFADFNLAFPAYEAQLNVQTIGLIVTHGFDNSLDGSGQDLDHL